MNIIKFYEGVIQNTFMVSVPTQVYIAKFILFYFG